MSEVIPPRQYLLNFPALAQSTFSSFIVTPGTQQAYEAALSFVQWDEGGDPIPLFLCGETGTGKTHLLLAMGNTLAEKKRPALYLDGNLFAESAAADLETTLSTTTQRIREANILLLDNLDAIAGNSFAQEVLYQCFNTIKEQGGKIAFAARVRPAQLPDTESYLTSRLQWGLVLDLEPPDDKALTLLLVKLGEDLGLEISGAVTDYLLLRLPRDIPSLQQAVRRLNEESLRQKKKVSIALAKTALNLDS